jgi:hypothetical protein
LTGRISPFASDDVPGIVCYLTVKARKFANACGNPKFAHSDSGHMLDEYKMLSENHTRL